MSGHLLPSKVRHALRGILSQMADLDEYNCLLFADAVERGEHTLAVDSLRRFFDRTIALQSMASVSADGEETAAPTPRYQYALLHLASVHAAFGYTDEAISALLECQEIARENHDADCLKFCRLWLHNLMNREDRPDSQRDAVIESLVDSSKRSNQVYLQALGELTIAKGALEQGKPPGVFFAAHTRALAIVNGVQRHVDAPDLADMLVSLRAPAQLLLLEAYRRYGFSSLSRTLDPTIDQFESSSDVVNWSKVVSSRVFDMIQYEGKWNEAEALVRAQMEKVKGHFQAEVELRKFWDIMCYERALRR